MAIDDRNRPRQPGIGGSAFLVQSAALGRAFDAGARPSGAAAAARLGLAERNAAAISLLRRDRTVEAAEALREVVADCTAALGPDDPDTVVAAGNLAVAHARAGELVEAVDLFEANLTSRAAVFGDDHPRTLDARDALATGLRLVGRADDAAHLHTLVASQRARTLGPDHPDTLVSRLGLALDLADAGDLDEAAAELDQLLHGHTDLGARHPLTTAVRVVAADVALALGWLDHAATQLQLACSASEAVHGRAHPDTAALRAELAEVVAGPTARITSP